MSDTEAGIAIVGIIFVASALCIVGCVWLWAWRGRAAFSRDQDYQKLAEDMSNAQRRSAFELGQIAEDLADVRVRMVELERILKEVD